MRATTDDLRICDSSTVDGHGVVVDNQRTRVYGRRRCHGIVRLLPIVCKGLGTALERILLGESHRKIVAIRDPSQGRSRANINVLWTCPGDRDDTNSLIGARETFLPVATWRN